MRTSRLISLALAMVPALSIAQAQTSPTAPKRPAVIVKELAVDIPYPRSSQTRFLPEFTELERQAGVALGIVHQ